MRNCMHLSIMDNAILLSLGRGGVGWGLEGGWEGGREEQGGRKGGREGEGGRKRKEESEREGEGGREKGREERSILAFALVHKNDTGIETDLHTHQGQH